VAARGRSVGRPNRGLGVEVPWSRSFEGFPFRVQMAVRLGVPSSFPGREPLKGVVFFAPYRPGLPGLRKSPFPLAFPCQGMCNFFRLVPSAAWSIELFGCAVGPLILFGLRFLSSSCGLPLTSPLNRNADVLEDFCPSGLVILGFPVFFWRSLCVVVLLEGHE